MAEHEIRCGFCNKSQDEVNNMLVSTTNPNIYICDSCAQKVYNSFKNLDHPFERDTDNLMTPTQIKAFLDQYVVGQDYAKQVLSVAFYNHMKLLEHYDNIQAGDVEISKSNVLLCGPTGSGKTFLVQCLAKLFKVPYAICDSTSLTESGYVGSDVETVLQKLIINADGDISKAERGIVFIDEIDKKANKGGESVSITRDVSGEGVQQALLKIIEGSVVNVLKEGRRTNPEASTYQINTSKILFIVGGAFPGIEKIIKKRLNISSKKPVGLAFDEDSSKSKIDPVEEYNSVIEKVTTDDFRKYGLIPEFLGRLPIICPLKELTEDELCKILTEPKNALVKQYPELLKYDNVKLDFEKQAIKAIAHKAIENTKSGGVLKVTKENIINNTMPELILKDSKEEQTREAV